VSSIGITDADGSHVHLVTNRRCTVTSMSECTYDSSPVWSPNGQQIAFVRLIPSFLRLDQSHGLGPFGPTGVYTVRPDGSAITKISTCGTQCRFTSIQWAADGSRLADVGTPYSLRNNTAMNSIDIASATGVVTTLPLTTHAPQPEEEWVAPAIAWARSGQRIALVAHQPNEPTALYTVPVHGTKLGHMAQIQDGAFPPVTWLPTAG
jgi:hypothetical protein